MDCLVARALIPHQVKEGRAQTDQNECKYEGNEKSHRGGWPLDWAVSMVNNKRLGRSWTAVVVFLVLAIVGMALGRWQLGRADEKRAMVSLRENRTLAVELGSRSAAGIAWDTELAVDRLDQQQVVLRGRWMPDQSIALDNRAWEGRAGVHVLTPMELADGSRIWVNRGWMAKPPGVMTVEIPSPAQADAIRGVALASVMRRMELSRNDESLRQGNVWQNFDWQASQARIGQRVWPVIVWQTDPKEDALLMKVPEVSNDVPKHLGYAAQWFLLSGVSLFFAWRLRPRALGPESK